MHKLLMRSQWAARYLIILHHTKNPVESEQLWCVKCKKKDRKQDKGFPPFQCYIWLPGAFATIVSSLLQACLGSQANTLQTPNGQSHPFGVSLSHSLSPYVGQSMCIDIFSVYGSPESRIGDHPRNRLSHFNAPWKWSSHVVSSISLFIAGSPPFTPLSDKEPLRASHPTQRNAVSHLTGSDSDSGRARGRKDISTLEHNGLYIHAMRSYDVVSIKMYFAAIWTILSCNFPPSSSHKDKKHSNCNH